MYNVELVRCVKLGGECTVKEKKNAGFTLIEVLIAMGIAMIVIAGVSQFMLAATRQYQAVDTQVNVQMDAQDALNTICDMVMQGNNIARYKHGKYTYFCVYYDLGEYDSSGNLKTYATAEQRMFYLDGDEIYMIHTKDGTEYNDAMSSQSNRQLLAEGVKNFNITTSSGSNIGKSGLSASKLESSTVNVNISFETAKIKSGASSTKATYDASQLVAIRNSIVDIAGR